MKRWMIATGIALMAFPGIASAERGYSSPAPSTCSDGSTCSCDAPCQKSCCASCCNLRCCGTWSLEGQALYWRVCCADEAYAVVRESSGNSAVDFVKGVEPDNEWGFKITGKYTSCDGCKFASLAYTYFDETDTSTTLNPSHTSFFGDNLDRLDARIRNEYQRLRGHLGHYVCNGCRGGFYGYGGISWIYIQDRQRMTAFDDPEVFRFHQSLTYSAAGFEAGVGGHYKVCGGFGLAAELGGVAAIGDREHKFDFSTPDSPVDFRKTVTPSVTNCVPGLDVKLEAFYECCCCCLNWGIMIGYELNYYFAVKKLQPLFFEDFESGEPNVFALDKNFGVSGLYFGVRVGY